MTQTTRRDALVVLLTVAAGAVNVLSLTGLGGVPASIMTANLVVVGLSVTRHEGTLGWHAGVALAGFAVAVLLATRLIRADAEDAAGEEGELGAGRPPWPRPVAFAIAAEALPLAGVAVAWGLTDARPAGAAQLTLCAVAAFAMGVQSAAVRALGVAGLSSTFFTGTLTDTVRGLAGPRPLRWSRPASGLVALVAGAAAEGAVLTYGQPRLGPLLPLVLVAGVAALSLRGFSRTG
jgi:uncharacterized membrane protein YoaK (UPF0700 family)